MLVEPLRTAIVPLTSVSADTAGALHETATQYTWCENETSDYCFPDQPKQPDDLITTKRAVRDAIYDRLKSETDLNANLVQAAIKQVVENVDALKTNWKKGRRISKPEYKTDDGWTMLFDKRSATFRKYGISLSLADGNRHWAEFELPNNLEGTPYSDYVLSELFEYRMTRIEYRPHGEHDFYAHIVTKATIEKPPIYSQTQEQIEEIVSERAVRTGWHTSSHDIASSDAHGHRRVLGVDLNVSGYSAVTSAGGFHGNADYLNHRRTQFEHIRQGMQQTGTYSAHTSLQSMNGREWRWFDQLAHHIANGICLDAIRTRCTDVAFENLEGIRSRISNEKKYQQWFFKRVQDYTEYKLKPYGITVETVTAKYTSQSCSRMDCGHTADANRDGKQFKCGRCGYELDADLNASKNIAYRYIREEIWGDKLSEGEKWFDPLEQFGDSGVSSGHKSRTRRADCQLALKSGTITLHGNFCREAWSTPDGQFTDKPHPQQSEPTVRASD